MHIETNETVRHLVVSIVEDFRSQLNGPFHRGGVTGLSFSAVRGLDDEKVCGFQIETGGSEWQEQVFTIRTCTGGHVEQRKVSCRAERAVEEITSYDLWMDVDTLKGLHRLAREHVQQSEIARDRRGQLDKEEVIFSKFLDKTLLYYSQAKETVSPAGSTKQCGE